CSSTRTGSPPPTRPPAASRCGPTPRCAPCRPPPPPATRPPGRTPIPPRRGPGPRAWVARDVPFGDPTSLLISPDHYVTRLLHAHGVPLDHLGVGGEPVDARAAWRALCTHWAAFRGTPSRFWLASELAAIFGGAGRPPGA